MKFLTALMLRVAWAAAITAPTPVANPGPLANHSRIALAAAPAAHRLSLSSSNAEGGLLSKARLHRLARAEAHFGDTLCPCIGFDNIEGETVVVFKEKHKASYPADLGARCEAWDDGRHPLSCQEGQKPGLGDGWCAQPWCYVDPCNCHVDVLPKMSSYVPDATYRGKPVFFSYATCGGKDMFTAEIPKLGSPGCRCIGFDNIPGTTEVPLAGGETVEYPAELGGSCQAWDRGVHPECKGLGKKAPAWCQARWCYVDPCSCDLEAGTVPKISAYLPKATFTGKNLYYSYETCGSPDTWTETGNPDACVNQETKDECKQNWRCAWTGKRCLGTELVSHPLCKGVAKKYKSSAPRQAPVALLAVFFAVLAMATVA